MAPIWIPPILELILSNAENGMLRSAHAAGSPASASRPKSRREMSVMRRLYNRPWQAADNDGLNVECRMLHRERRASTASEPRDRSAPAKRRARARVEESEGRSPSDENEDRALQHHLSGPVVSRTRADDGRRDRRGEAVRLRRRGDRRQASARQSVGPAAPPLSGAARPRARRGNRDLRRRREQRFQQPDPRAPGEPAALHARS